KRYASALDLALDLHRWLEGAPIHARPPGLLEQANRVVKQSPGLAVAFVVLGAALFLFDQLHGLLLPDILALRGVSGAGLRWAVVPVAGLVLAFLALAASPGRAALAGVGLALAGVVAWFAFPAWRPERDVGGSFLRLLAWPGLVVLVVGVLPRWRL